MTPSSFKRTLVIKKKRIRDRENHYSIHKLYSLVGFVAHICKEDVQVRVRWFLAAVADSTANPFVSPQLQHGTYFFLKPNKRVSRSWITLGDKCVWKLAVSDVAVDSDGKTFSEAGRVDLA